MMEDHNVVLEDSTLTIHSIIIKGAFQTAVTCKDKVVEMQCSFSYIGICEVFSLQVLRTNCY